MGTVESEKRKIKSQAGGQGELQCSRKKRGFVDYDSRFVYSDRWPTNPEYTTHVGLSLSWSQRRINSKIFQILGTVVQAA